MKSKKEIFGILLIIVAVTILVYDFLSPPAGEISNVTLVIFAKLVAIAGSLLNLDLKKMISD